MAEASRAKWQVRTFASHAEADEHEAEYWLQILPEERLAAQWELSLRVYRLAGLCADAPRLDRTAIRVYRG